MTAVTKLIDAAAGGDQEAAASLLPLVYDELRKLAASLLTRESPGQTLQATALVHEAYLRLVGHDVSSAWNGRGHFFGAAAEAMRRILVEAARKKGRVKHGGGRHRVALLDSPASATGPDDDLLALDEALDRLESANPQAAGLVKLRYFAGFTNREAAGLLGISPRKADQLWAYSRAYLLDLLTQGQGESC